MLNFKNNNIMILFSIIAMITSFMSLGLSMYFFSENKRTDKYRLNLGLIYETEKMLKTDNELLLLHGINPEEIKNDNISQEEFYYIFASLRVSESYYIINNKADRLSDLRTHFLNNDKVELVYKKYLRNKLITSSVFTDIVDNFYLDKEGKR